MKAHWSRRLRAIDACNEAVDYAKGFRSASAAWKACERGDWMLWWLRKTSGEWDSKTTRRVVLACCECARLSLHLVKHGNERQRKAIELAERFGNCEAVTKDELRSAASSAAAAAADAADAAASSAAADAAYAAAAAASSAAAADAYAAAAYAYAAAAYAASSAAAARTDTLKQCADIVRKHFPNPPRNRSK